MFVYSAMVLCSVCLQCNGAMQSLFTVQWIYVVYIYSAMVLCGVCLQYNGAVKALFTVQ